MVGMNLVLGRLSKNVTVQSSTLSFISYSSDSCRNENPRQAGLSVNRKLGNFCFPDP